MFLVSFSGGRFCSFSPSIEQSQKVCISLEENGFVEIQSLEILQNEEIVKMKNIPVMDLEFLKHKVSVACNLCKIYIFFLI
jgi:tRNA (adenine57-N1/adenine58-N1)-methyltransferase catalytic subunit